MIEEVWKVYNNFIDRQFSNLGRYKIDNYILDKHAELLIKLGEKESLIK